MSDNFYSIGELVGLTPKWPKSSNISSVYMRSEIVTPFLEQAIYMPKNTLSQQGLLA